MHKTPLKNISVALVTAFLLQDAAWAAPEISIRPDHKLELSSEFSKISDEYRGSIPKRIIHIQDAHTNLSAQKNMAKVIEELVSRHHIQTVFVEGGTQDDSLTSLRPLADKSTRERVAKKYMMQGEMAGEEYLNLVSDLDFKIQGVEELSLYKKNLEYYRSLAASREKIFGYLHEIEKRAESLKRQLYPGHLLALDALAEKFEKKEADFTTYLDVLSDEAKKAGVNVLGYPQLLALGELKAKESQIDFQKANEEQMALFKAIQKTDPAKAQELKKIAGKTQKLRFQSTELGAFYESLIKEAGRNSVPVPQLEKYADYLGFYSRLHFESLLLEIEQIQNEIFGKALSNGDAYSLYETSIYLKKLSKLFSLQATRNDVDAYVESRKDPRFRTVTVVAFLNRALYDLNREAEVLTYNSIIEDNLKTVEGFYEATRERDEVFVKKALEQMDRDKLSSAALITGGYHTGNLKKLLQERGVSYTVVTPHVFEETNMKRYEKLLLSQFGGAASLVQSPSLNFQHTKSFMNLVKAVERPGFIERFRFELSAPSMQAAGARMAHQNDKAPDLIERAARFSKPTLESVMQSVYLIAQWLEANGFPEADYVRLYAIAFSNATVMSDNYPGVFTKYIENGSVGLGVNLKKYHEESAYDRMGPNFIAHLVTLIVRESAGYIYMMLANPKSDQRLFSDNVNGLMRAFATALVKNNLTLKDAGHRKMASSFFFPNQRQIIELAAPSAAGEFFEGRAHHRTYDWLHQRELLSGSSIIPSYLLGQSNEQILSTELQIILPSMVRIFFLNDVQNMAFSMGFVYAMYYLLQSHLWVETSGLLGISPETMDSIKKGDRAPRDNFQRAARDFMVPIGNIVSNIDHEIAISMKKTGARMATVDLADVLRTELNSAMTTGDQNKLERLVEKASKSSLNYFAFVSAFNELFISNSKFYQFYRSLVRKKLLSLEQGRLNLDRLFPPVEGMRSLAKGGIVFVDYVDPRRSSALKELSDEHRDRERLEAFRNVRKVLNLNESFLKDTIRDIVQSSRQTQIDKLEIEVNRIMAILQKKARSDETALSSIKRLSQSPEKISRAEAEQTAAMDPIRVIRFRRDNHRSVYAVLIPYDHEEKKLLPFVLHVSNSDVASARIVEREYTMLEKHAGLEDIEPFIVDLYRPYYGVPTPSGKVSAYSSQYMNLHPALKFDGKNFYLHAPHLKVRSATFRDADSTRRLAMMTAKLLTLFYRGNEKTMMGSFSLDDRDIFIDRRHVIRRGVRNMSATLRPDMPISSVKIGHWNDKHITEEPLDFLDQLFGLSYIRKKGLDSQMKPELREAFVTGILQGFVDGWARHSDKRKEELGEARSLLLAYADKIEKEPVSKSLIFTPNRIRQFVDEEINPQLATGDGELGARLAATRPANAQVISSDDLRFEYWKFDDGKAQLMVNNPATDEMLVLREGSETFIRDMTVLGNTFKLYQTGEAFILKDNETVVAFVYYWEHMSDDEWKEHPEHTSNPEAESVLGGFLVRQNYRKYRLSSILFDIYFEHMISRGKTDIDTTNVVVLPSQAYTFKNYGFVPVPDEVERFTYLHGNANQEVFQKDPAAPAVARSNGNGRIKIFFQNPFDEAWFRKWVRDHSRADIYDYQEKAPEGGFEIALSSVYRLRPEKKAELMSQFGGARLATKEAVFSASRAERLKEIREALGMIQEEFGAALGLSQSSITLMESRRMRISADLYAKAKKLYKEQAKKIFKEIRLSLDLSQTEFGVDLRPLKPLDKSVVSLMEKGRSPIRTWAMLKARELLKTIPAKQIKEIREALGLSQSEFGQQLRPNKPLAHEYISQMEQQASPVPVWVRTKAKEVYKSHSPKRLRSVREYLGMYQPAFGRALDRHTSFIYSMESGLADIPVIVLVKANQLRQDRSIRAKRLNEIREYLPLSQKEFGRALRPDRPISQVFVSRMELKRTAIPDWVLTKAIELRRTYPAAQLREIRMALGLSQTVMGSKLRPEKPLAQTYLFQMESVQRNVPQWARQKAARIYHELAANRLSHIRASLDMSLEMFGAALNPTKPIYRDTIAQMESGDTEIPVRYLLKANALIENKFMQNLSKAEEVMRLDGRVRRKSALTSALAREITPQEADLRFQQIMGLVRASISSRYPNDSHRADTFASLILDISRDVNRRASLIRNYAKAQAMPQDEMDSILSQIALDVYEAGWIGARLTQIQDVIDDGAIAGPGQVVGVVHLGEGEEDIRVPNGTGFVDSEDGKIYRAIVVPAVTSSDKVFLVQFLGADGLKVVSEEFFGINFKMHAAGEWIWTGPVEAKKADGARLSSTVTNATITVSEGAVIRFGAPRGIVTIHEVNSEEEYLTLGLNGGQPVKYVGSAKVNLNNQRETYLYSTEAFSPGIGIRVRISEFQGSQAKLRISFNGVPFNLSVNGENIQPEGTNRGAVGQNVTGARLSETLTDLINAKKKRLRDLDSIIRMVSGRGGRGLSDYYKERKAIMRALAPMERSLKLAEKRPEAPSEAETPATTLRHNEIQRYALDEAFVISIMDRFKPDQRWVFSRHMGFEEVNVSLNGKPRGVLQPGTTNTLGTLRVVFRQAVRNEHLDIQNLGADQRIEVTGVERIYGARMAMSDTPSIRGDHPASQLVWDTRVLASLVSAWRLGFIEEWPTLDSIKGWDTILQAIHSSVEEIANAPDDKITQIVRAKVSSNFSSEDVERLIIYNSVMGVLKYAEQLKQNSTFNVMYGPALSNDDIVAYHRIQNIMPDIRVDGLETVVIETKTGLTKIIDEIGDIQYLADPEKPENDVIVFRKKTKDFYVLLANGTTYRVVHIAREGLPQGEVDLGVTASDDEKDVSQHNIRVKGFIDRPVGSRLANQEKPVNNVVSISERPRREIKKPERIVILKTGQPFSVYHEQEARILEKRDSWPAGTRVNIGSSDREDALEISQNSGKDILWTVLTGNVLGQTVRITVETGMQRDEAERILDEIVQIITPSRTGARMAQELSGEQLIGVLDQYKASYLFVGPGRTRYADFEEVKRALKNWVSRLDKKHGRGQWLAVYGGDPADNENPDIGLAMKALKDEYAVPVLAVQNEKYKASDVLNWVTYVHYYPGVRDANGRTLYGGLVDGKPVAATAIYLSDEFMDHGLNGVIAFGAAGIAYQEALYAQKGNIEVYYERMKVRNPGESQDPYGEQNSLFQALTRPADFNEAAARQAASEIVAMLDQPVSLMKQALDGLSAGALNDQKKIMLRDASDAVLKIINVDGKIKTLERSPLERRIVIETVVSGGNMAQYDLVNSGAIFTMGVSSLTDSSVMTEELLGRLNRAYARMQRVRELLANYISSEGPTKEFLRGRDQWYVNLEVYETASGARLAGIPAGVARTVSFDEIEATAIEYGLSAASQAPDNTVITFEHDAETAAKGAAFGKQLPRMNLMARHLLAHIRRKNTDPESSRYTFYTFLWQGAKVSVTSYGTAGLQEVLTELYQKLGEKNARTVIDVLAQYSAMKIGETAIIDGETRRFERVETVLNAMQLTLQAPGIGPKIVDHVVEPLYQESYGLSLMLHSAKDQDRFLRLQAAHAAVLRDMNRILNGARLAGEEIEREERRKKREEGRGKRGDVELMGERLSAAVNLKLVADKFIPMLVNKAVVLFSFTEKAWAATLENGSLLASSGLQIATATNRTAAEASDVLTPEKTALNAVMAAIPANLINGEHLKNVEVPVGAVSREWAEAFIVMLSNIHKSSYGKRTRFYLGIDADQTGMWKMLLEGKSDFIFAGAAPKDEGVTVRLVSTEQETALNTDGIINLPLGKGEWIGQAILVLAAAAGDLLAPTGKFDPQNFHAVDVTDAFVAGFNALSTKYASRNTIRDITAGTAKWQTFIEYQLKPVLQEIINEARTFSILRRYLESAA